MSSYWLFPVSGRIQKSKASFYILAVWCFITLIIVKSCLFIFSQRLQSTFIFHPGWTTMCHEVGRPQQKTPNFRCPKLYLDWSTWEELVTLRFEIFDHDLSREGWLSMNAVWFTLAQLKRHAAFKWICWHQYSSVRWKYFLVSEWVNAFNSLWCTADSTGRSHPAFTRSLLLYMCRIQCSSRSPRHYVTH